MKFKINELSKVLGITSMTLRRYENYGYIVPERDKSDYRWYDNIDIVKMIEIRLLRKTGFSHGEIHSMTENSLENMRKINIDRLNAIDEEMRRMKYLRHWLKDNIALIDNTRKIGNGFFEMVCPVQKYVLYGTDREIFKESGRLKTINDFLYTIEEVKSIFVIKMSEIYSGNPLPYYGIAVKEIDIPRLGIEDIVINNEYVETYPSKPCIFSVIECEKNDESFLAEYKAFIERVNTYLYKKNLVNDGDIIGMITDVISSKWYFMMCVPVKKK